MSEFSDGTWAVLACIAAASIVGVLHVLATAVRNEAHIQDVRVRVANLKREYTRRVAGETDEAQIVGAIGAANVQPSARRAA